jgi:glutaredoxin
LLDALNLSPKPVFFFLDQRGEQSLVTDLGFIIHHHSLSWRDFTFADDGNVLAPLIKRLTGGTGFPILLVGGQHQGDFDDIEKLFSSGDLQRRLTAAGAKIRATKVRKGRRRQ